MTARLVTRQQVAAYMKTQPAPSMEAHITIAEALVAGHLMAKSLHEHDAVETQRLLYPADLIELSDGPATGFNGDSVNASFLMDGSPVAEADLVLGYWYVKFVDGFSKGATLILRHKSGWTAKTCPVGVREAIILTAGLIFKRPDQSVISERLGDYSYATASAAAAESKLALSPAAMLLLREFRRPRA